MDTRNGILFPIIGFLVGATAGFIALYFALPSSPENAEQILRIIDPKIIYRTIEIRYALLTILSILGLGLLGAVLGVVFLLGSELREKSTKLRATLEVNRTKKEFISMILHHLRTPLSGMRWALKDALKNLGEADPHKKTIQMLYDENIRALNAVEHLVEASRASVGRIEYHFEVIPINELIVTITQSVEALGSSAQRKGLKLHTNIAPTSEDSVKVDKEKVGIVVQTLLENAITLTPKGGSIEISIEEKNNDLLFHIEDTGVGISKEDQPRIFLQFFRGKNARRIEPGGFGVGLYIAKVFVENHGGTIWFISEEGKGTMFTFRLPILRAATEKFLEKVS